MKDNEIRALHNRLDRLTDLVDRRFQQIEDHLRGMDRDTEEVRGILLALKDGFNEAVDEFATEADEADFQRPLPSRLN